MQRAVNQICQVTLWCVRISTKLPIKYISEKRPKFALIILHACMQDNPMVPYTAAREVAAAAAAK